MRLLLPLFKGYYLEQTLCEQSMLPNYHKLPYRVGLTFSGCSNHARTYRARQVRSTASRLICQSQLGAP